MKNQSIIESIGAIRKYFLWHTILDLFGEMKYYASRLLLSQPRIIKDMQGHKMMLDISCKGIHKYLYMFGIHEPQSTRIFSEIIPKNAKVVDIGANIGYYVLLEAKKAQKIYAIEPEPRNLELLRENIRLNSYEECVEVYQLAVSNEVGKTYLSISDIPNHHRLIIPAGTPQDRDIEIETITLDEFIKDNHVDVIRMDLEGAEWLVINGMKKILRNGKPLILFIEVHPKLINDYGGDVMSMLELLFDSNFQISHLAVYEPLNTKSFRSWFKLKGYSRHKAIEFNPYVERNTLNGSLYKTLFNSNHYSLFLKRE